MRISNEILFEEHAAVFEQAAHTIASSMNVPLDAVRLIHGRKIGVSCCHLLKLESASRVSAAIISEDEIAFIPTWPLNISTYQKIHTALIAIL